MIVTKLIGGLGNQMFQYATGRSLSKKLNTELWLDLSGFNKYKTWGYTLDIFNLNTKISPDKLNTIIKAIRKTPLKKHIIFEEKKYTFDSNLAKYQFPFLYLDGYWQSYKYFQDISDTIREDFTFHGERTKNYARQINRIKKSNSVSVHVRRGDYLTNPSANKFFCNIGIDYYKKSKKMIDSQTTDPVYYIFSDDILWCKKNLTFFKNSYYVENNKMSQDLELMSLCKNHITANSTFSWWGAWLGNSKSGITITPKSWFTDKDYPIRDLIPQGWIKL